ncbi:unspecific monooxygenase [Ancylostoma ceylanicum]|uniref:Unspecific monooxygenase n=1 Tax=Ancylostoma ceylanicum TaxID=53326 RepID=A0A0D6M4B0_9BILA|nr:unspecific monooxygenase [Ancylostoma ceylanicum]
MLSIVVLLFISAIVIYIWRFYENTDFRRLHMQIADYTKIYGNVFTLWLPKPHVVITDYEGIKEAFAKKGDDFSGRSAIFPQIVFQNVENGGVIFSQGENWKEQRRISLHILRDFGMGKNLMEEQVLLSAQEFLAHLASIKNKEEIDLRTPIQVKKNITEDVERCLKTYNPDQEPECFVQAYYQRMQTNPNLDYDNLLNVCMDFFLAGMETTTTTLRWGTLILAEHIDIQEKIREEIFSVLGADGRPSTSLRNRLPYTNAAIQEIQRYANIIPLNVIHRTVKDTSVESIPIPGDTLVIGHIQHVMAHSPVYKDANEFRPERFLMEDGITPNKEAVEQLCPFSVGKRQCAGEGLAKVELFIGLITLLQNYKIEPVKGRQVDLEPIFASVLLPKQQPLRLTPVTV